MVVDGRTPVAAPTPPHDAGAEQALLGSLLINGEALPLVEPLVQPGDFYRPHHGWVYQACLALASRGEPVNEVTVAHDLVVQGQLDQAGGLAYLAELTLATPSSLHAEHYARIVSDMALRRKLMQAGARITNLGFDPEGATADAALAQAEELLTSLRRTTGSEFTHIREVLGSALQFASGPLADSAAAAQEKVPTGFPALDSLLGGFYRSNLIVVAARPGMGKTSLLLGFARNAAVREKARVAIFSLEMSQRELVQRLLSAEASIDSTRLRTGILSSKEQERIWPAAGRLAESDIWFCDVAALTLAEMRGRLRRLHRQAKVDVVIVDYLQLMLPPAGSRANRVEQVSEITRGLKALAREINVPLIAAAQLNRAVEHRQPHTPMLSDLRESGSIEADADVVMFIHREDQYYTEEQWERQYPTKAYPRHQARIIVAKQRNGPTGDRDLYFREEHTKFEPLTWESE